MQKVWLTRPLRPGRPALPSSSVFSFHSFFFLHSLYSPFFSTLARSIMPGDEQQRPSMEPRKKRVKIVSACSECRRKKTKCNGEQPCSTCLKAAVHCIYPSSAQTEDRRNAPSKAALEAIEERLKTIEDMLKTILQTQISVADLDPVLVNSFLNRNKGHPASGSPVPSSSLPPLHRQRPPSPQPSAAAGSMSPPPSRSSPPVQRPVPTAGSPRLSSAHDYRLPSIHNLSAPSSAYPRLTDSSPREHHRHDLPPLAFQHYRRYSPPPAPLPPQSASPSEYRSEDDEYAQHPVKKRKR